MCKFCSDFLTTDKTYISDWQVGHTWQQTRAFFEVDKIRFLWCSVEDVHQVGQWECWSKYYICIKLETTTYEPRHETNNVVSKKVWHKPSGRNTEYGWRLGILDLERRGIVLSV